MSYSSFNNKDRSEYKTDNKDTEGDKLLVPTFQSSPTPTHKFEPSSSYTTTAADGLGPTTTTTGTTTGHSVFDLNEVYDDFNDFNDEEDEGIILPNKNDQLLNDLAEVGLPAPPDGGWGWIIVAASFIINFMMDGVTSAFSVLLPQIVLAYQETNPGIGVSDVAWAGSLLTGISLCTGPIISALTNKFGCRIVCGVGAVVSFSGFIGAANAPSLEILLVTYGVIGGLGFGLLYLPAIVCVSYYFERRRALATGIAVSGSGFGAIVFCPVITAIKDSATWRQVCVGFSFMLGSLLLAAITMKPLEISVAALRNSKRTPLLQRMADDKKSKMERASYAGSDYFMVKLPDGSMERRIKMSLNVDPGVHSGLHLDQLLLPVDPVIGTPILSSITTNVDKLPTITEQVKPLDNSIQDSNREDESTKKIFTLNPPEKIVPPTTIVSAIDTRPQVTKISPPQRIASAPTDIPLARNRIRERRVSEGDRNQQSNDDDDDDEEGAARNESIEFIKKAATQKPKYGVSLPIKITSPTENIETGKESKDVDTPKDKKSMSTVRSSASVGKSKSRKSSIGSSTHRRSISSVRGDNPDDESKFLLSQGEFSGLFRRLSSTSRSRTLSKATVPGAETSETENNDTTTINTNTANTDQDTDKYIIRPMSRKDIFYSGSIHHLPEYQSPAGNYHQSVLNIPSKEGALTGLEIPQHKPIICACLRKRTGAFKTALAQMLNFGLVKNPVFLIIAISGVIGMLGFYVPITYAVSYGMEKGLKESQAAWFVSIIGITSTVGRVGFGMLSDLKRVNSFLVYNLCIVIMGIAICIIPATNDFYFLAFLFFVLGTALSGFVSLSSIILVKLLGLENLTNAFGLLIFFRGISTVVGTPISGAIYDLTGSYDLPFYLAGFYVLLSGLVSFIDMFVIKCQAKKLAAAIALADQHSTKLSLAGGGLEDILEEGAETSNSSSELSNSSSDTNNGKGNNDESNPKQREQQRNRLPDVIMTRGGETRTTANKPTDAMMVAGSGSVPTMKLTERITPGSLPTRVTSSYT